MSENPAPPESEQLGEVTAEVHRVGTADGAVLAVTHIPAPAGKAIGRPVILLHGTYSKRNFWISPQGIGLGPCLAGAGFDVWIPELRGHGLSPKPDDFAAITAEEQIRYDIPAIQAFVDEQTRQPAAWAGHSFGGVYVLAALAAGWLDPEKIPCLLTFGSQVSQGERFLKIPPLAWLCKRLLRRLGYLPAPRLGLGPEVEAAAAMIEVIGWKQLGGRWVSREGFSYWDGLKTVAIPVHAFAAAADKNDPPQGCKLFFDQLGSREKTFTLLGRQSGFQMDYDHIGMIVSKPAQAEVWPLIAATLQRCGQSAGRKYPG